MLEEMKHGSKLRIQSCLDVLRNDRKMGGAMQAFAGGER